MAAPPLLGQYGDDKTIREQHEKQCNWKTSQTIIVGEANTNVSQLEKLG